MMASFQVSSVLLYGIPIVSLFIEGQERLCLAQISNTLLKQFSYNEIHNRRVALGITCVQCTPVQLEILRRAGAMPVSSRRCGMITRREAERLCKSFLGDNTPPRLPDDFAFNVQHKCAWGCRGAFLPARYNSSRAKCIKCTFCGMFFSPNKFIFHSHRVTTNDRYIQPDAANFNSWRRHMTLCGHTQEEKIVHAWEDVKAMFNGGTRKRLVGCSSNRNQNSPATITVPATTSGAAAAAAPTATKIYPSPASSGSLTNKESTTYSKSRSLDQPYDYNTVAAATAAVVGVTAVAATVGVPFNVHRSTVDDLSIMPISSNFVVDYTMWQQQQQQQQTQPQPQQQHMKKCFEPCSHSWTRPEPPFIKNEPYSGKCRKLSDSITDFHIPTILNSSAFKPVVASAAIVSTSLYAARASSDSNSNTYITPETRTTTVFTHNSITATPQRTQYPDANPVFATSPSLFSPILDSGFSSLNTTADPETVFGRQAKAVDDDDEEVVDIETTEEETQIAKVIDDVVTFNVVCPRVNDRAPSRSPSLTNDDISCQSASPNVEVDVDGFTTDVDEQVDFKSKLCSNVKINQCDNEKTSTIPLITNAQIEIRKNFTEKIEVCILKTHFVQLSAKRRIQIV